MWALLLKMAERSKRLPIFFSFGAVLVGIINFTDLKTSTHAHRNINRAYYENILTK